MLSKPLRFILLLDSDNVPAWQAQCIREALDSKAAVLVAVVMRAESVATPRPSLLGRLKANRSKLLWRAFNRLYVNKICTASRLESLTELLQDIPVIEDDPVPVGRFSERLSDTALTFVEEAQPDFILRFGFGILKGPILKAAPLGIWSFHHGDPARFRGQPPGFWEIFTGAETTGTVLQVLSEELDGGRVLQSGEFRTILHSYAKTRDALYFGASNWVAKSCKEFLVNGSFSRTSVDSNLRGAILREPNNRQMARFLWKTVINYWRMIADYKLSRQSWIVGIIDAPIHEVAGLAGPVARDSALERVSWLPARPYQFDADPFGYALDTSGTVRMLFECYDWRTKRGEIQSVVFDGHSFRDRRTALSATTHLSYPFVLKHDGKTFFIPEHSQARNVSAFELSEDGVALSKRTIFGRSEMVDATFFEWDGKFWAFALLDVKAANAELSIFYSESLWGPWLAHPQNPVKVNVSSARPAGTPFLHDGILFRPAQDCGPNYGSAVVINCVKKLTTSEFEETEVARLSPPTGSRYNYGIHTLSTAGNYTLIDASRKEWKFFAR